MDPLRYVVRAGFRHYPPMRDHIIGQFARLVRRGSYVRERIAGEDPLHDSTRAAVYVHFDKDGIVHDYVMHQLCELKDAGYRITFVSNAPRLAAESHARVRQFCKELIWRFNTGYDFGAYKDGINLGVDLDRIDSLILMNDSIYGPFRNLRDTLESIDTRTTDFWGIADSFEIRYHIQTFFMVFMPDALRSPAFRKFWSDLPYVNDRMWVIRNVEVILTQILQESGLRTGVLAPYEAVAATARDRLRRQLQDLPDTERKAYDRFGAKVMGDGVVNPMQFFWDVLITDYACPFIKRDLLALNLNNVPGTSKWPDIIASHSNYDTAMITGHLKR